MSEVYALRDGNAVKFGMADQPLQRIAALQTGNPRPWTTAIIIPLATVDSAGNRVVTPREYAVRAEALIHEYLAAERVGGEWFAGPKTNALMAAMASSESPDVAFNEMVLGMHGVFCAKHSAWWVRGENVCAGCHEEELDGYRASGVLDDPTT